MNESERKKPTVHERWAHLRFSVVGALLAAPPRRGELQAELERLAQKSWVHPVTEERVRFGVSTVERWYHQARKARLDPVGVLRRKVRKDVGQDNVPEPLKEALRNLCDAPLEAVTVERSKVKSAAAEGLRAIELKL